MYGKMTSSAVTYMLIPSMQIKLTVKPLELGLLKKEGLTSFNFLPLPRSQQCDTMHASVQDPV